MPETIIWAEDLPDNCPPDDAFKPENGEFYRLVASFPPSEEDFCSHRKLYPHKKFNASECVMRACSIISTFERCKSLSKLPLQRGKIIVKFILTPSAGLIKKTGGHSDHYSWWRLREFDPIPICKEVEE